MRYEKEFNAEAYNIPNFLLTWDDCSWHNDACPRFENVELGIAVWVETIDPEGREYEDWKQYTIVGIVTIDNGERTELLDDTLFETDDPEKLKAWIAFYTLKDHLENAFAIAGQYSESIADELAGLIAETQEAMDELTVSIV
jgi:hypothetical protein